MASIRRTDIMHKRLSKGRPVKTDKEKFNRRQEAYKWRDARRIYLAESFDRWRKLRSVLKLKDSSLAWHLMEAHEKGSCAACRKGQGPKSSKPTVKVKCEETEFLSALIASVRHLCHTHFSFEESIQVVGLLSLEVDRMRREQFRVNEFVRSGKRPALPRYISKSHHQLSEPIGGTTTGLIGLSGPLGEQDIEPNVYESGDNKPGTTDVAATAALVNVQRKSGSELTEENPKCSSPKNLPVHSSINPVSHESLSFISPEMQQKSSSDESPASPKPERNTVHKPTVSLPRSPMAVEDNKTFFEEVNPSVNSTLCSDSEPSFEIDVEKVDTSQEMEDPLNVWSKNIHETVRDMESTDHLQNNVKETVSEASRSPSLSHLHSSDVNPPTYPPRDISHDVSERTSGSHLMNVDERENKEILQTEEEEDRESHGVFSERGDTGILLQISNREPTKDPVEEETMADRSEMPLDMTMWKHNGSQHVKIEPEQSRCPSAMSDSVHQAETVSKHEVSCHNTLSPSGKRKMNSGMGSPSSAKLAKQLNDHQLTIPWQRRDMSRKEEYEFLEVNPFADLSEFSQRYPHVHQRTYYRWKKRIKEEYMVLEQNPEMSFQEFSSVVLQAKESVFNLWKKMIVQGRGFYSPGDASKKLELKPTVVTSVKSSEYNTLQRNLSMSFEMFSQLHPGVSRETFNSHKHNIMQEFCLFHQNPQVSYKEFSKSVNISEDTFKLWQEQAELMKRQFLSPSGTSQLPPIYQASTSSSQLEPAITKVLGESASLNPLLADSMVRSASYLASLQTMMLSSWQNYYGLAASPLSQQMLPMMLWPGMMGGLGRPTAPTGPLPRTSPIPGMTAGMLGHLVTPLDSDPTASSSRLNAGDEQRERAESVERRGEPDREEVGRENRREEIGRENRGGEIEREYRRDGTEIMERREDTDKEDLNKQANKRRKHNRVEYLYYLGRPNLHFKDLAAMFPSISMRTFYRWRKEINAAVLLLEDNRDLSFPQFELIFPDIPEEYFEAWKDKISQGLSIVSQLDTGDKDKDCAELATGEKEEPTNHRESKSIESSLAKFWEHKSDTHKGNVAESAISKNFKVESDEVTVSNKRHKEEFSFIQMNPDIDFASFSKYFPNASVRSFYRWKKELKDLAEQDRASSADDLQDKCSGGDFLHSVRKSEVLDQSKEVKEECENRERRNGPEYTLVLMNPYIESSEFAAQYPHIPKRTFNRWKREIHQILEYLRVEPHMKLEYISQILPEVTTEAFEKWKDLIAQEGAKEEARPNGETVSWEKSDAQDLKPFFYFMHNPTLSFSELTGVFPNVSPEVFTIWIERMKSIVAYIQSNSCIDHERFCADIQPVSRELFESWKSLHPHHIGVGRDGLEAIEFCHRHPDISYSEFSQQYPAIAETTFLQWMTVVTNENKPSAIDLAISRENCELSSTVEGNSSQSNLQLPDSGISSQPAFPGPEFNQSAMDDTPGPSTLSSLARFADDTVRKYSAETDFLRLSSTHKDPSHNNNSEKSRETAVTVDNFLNVPSVSEKQSRPSSSESLYHGGADERNSLSALMSFSEGNSRDSTPGRKDVSSNKNLAVASPSAVPWSPGKVSTPGKDDDEGFSSQRQKKMSRAEYMYVKDNPDVDSQEFSRIFPGVSARTFYRWKKEIRAQLQLA